MGANILCSLRATLCPDSTGMALGEQWESSLNPAAPMPGASTSSGITGDQIPSLPQILKVLLMRFKIKRHCQEHLVPPRRHCWGRLAQPVLHSSAQRTNLAVSLSSLLTHAFLGRTDAKQNPFTRVTREQHLEGLEGRVSAWCSFFFKRWHQR